jgi:hypothetical protein
MLEYRANDNYYKTQNEIRELNGTPLPWFVDKFKINPEIAVLVL